jgi:hypothetical protein
MRINRLGLTRATAPGANVCVTLGNGTACPTMGALCGRGDDNCNVGPGSGLALGALLIRALGRVRGSGGSRGVRWARVGGPWGGGWVSVCMAGQRVVHAGRRWLQRGSRGAWVDEGGLASGCPPHRQQLGTNPLSPPCPPIRPGCRPCCPTPKTYTPAPLHPSPTTKPPPTSIRTGRAVQRGAIGWVPATPSLSSLGPA